MLTKKVMIIFGTRPEAIKLAPVISELKTKSKMVKTIVCITGQHKEMLDQFLTLFKINPDYNLNVMVYNQTLFDITAKILTRLKNILLKEKPDLILIQGDTTSAFISSLVGSYLKIPVGHVEAGLRTYDKLNPFPEENNRRLISVLADYHFAPTAWARNNLLQEKIPANQIWVTGNTVVDAMLAVLNNQKPKSKQEALNSYFKRKYNLDLRSDDNVTKFILVTAHRRESFGAGLENICYALKEIAEERLYCKIIYPVHPNPNVRKPVRRILGKAPNIFLITPLSYEFFVYLMSKCYLILSDSGGIQEEASSLGKPVLVMRRVTERPEGIEAGILRLVGVDKNLIVSRTLQLLDNGKIYKKMVKSIRPYGDGKASKRIVSIILKSGLIKNRP